MSDRSVRIEVLGIFGAFVGVATLEIALHWYMGTRQGWLPEFLSNFYLYHTPLTGKQPYLCILDLLLPDVVLAPLAGYLCRPWGNGRLVWYTAWLSAGIVALFPVYLMFFPRGVRPWWPPPVRDLVLQALANWLICLIIAVVFAEHVSKRANVLSSKN